MAEDLDRPGDVPVQVATDGILKGDTVEVIKRLKEESRTARLPQKLLWDEAWALYNGRYDFSRKAAFQSKNALPRINTSIRAAAYMMRRGLVGPNDYFSTEGIGTFSKAFAPHLHKLTNFHLDQGKFASNYTTALLSGLLTSMTIMKVYPRMVNEIDVELLNSPRGQIVDPHKPQGIGSLLGPTQSRLRRTKRKQLQIVYEPVNQYDYYPDAAHGRHKIHSIKMGWMDYQERVAKGQFSKEVALLIEDEFVRMEENIEDAIRKGENPGSVPPTAFNKQVHLDEFWGDLPDLRGRLAFKNAYAVMINEKYMAVEPRPNNLPLQRDPFVIGPVIEKPFSTWHQGFVESVLGLQTMLTELGNLMIDGALFSSTRAYELDIDQVYDPHEFQNGVHPGKMFKKRGGGQSNAPMIREIGMGQFPPEVMAIFSLIDREFQTGTGMNEFISPQLGGRGDRSATEVNVKGQQASEFMSEIARFQEETVIEPSIVKSYQYMIHYQRHFDTPLMMEILGPEAAQEAQLMMQDRDVRDFFKEAPIKHKAHGISSMMSRMKDLDKIMAFINLVGNFAKADPSIIQKLDVMGLLKKGIRAMGFSESELIKDGQDLAKTTSAPVPGDGSGGGPLPSPGLPPVSAPAGLQQEVNGASGPSALGSFPGLGG